MKVAVKKLPQGAGYVRTADKKSGMQAHAYMTRTEGGEMLIKRIWGNPHDAQVVIAANMFIERAVSEK